MVSADVKRHVDLLAIINIIVKRSESNNVRTTTVSAASDDEEEDLIHSQQVHFPPAVCVRIHGSGQRVRAVDWFLVSIGSVICRHHGPVPFVVRTHPDWFVNGLVIPQL